MRIVSSLAVLAIGASVAVPSAARGQQAGEPIRYVGSSPNRALADAVVVGNTIYLSGKLGTVPRQGMVEGGIEPETRQTMENIKSALEELGATMDDVVKCTVFLADMAEWGQMNRVYTTFFPKHKPARSAVGVNGLALNARVEIECMAVVGARDAG